MADLTLREIKGSPLTFNEIDNNFINAAGYSKNYLINGGFDIWQRGRSRIGTSIYGADMWFQTINGGGTVATTRITLDPGQTDIPGNPVYYKAITVNPGVDFEFVNIQNRIEGADVLAGEEVTVSFYGKVGSGTQNVIVQVFQFNGTGGTPLQQGIGFGTIVLDTTWRRYTRTATLPSLSGVTLGPNHYTFLVLQFRDANNETYHISNVQLEKGSVATAFERPHYADNLAQCERYYQKSYAVDVTPGTASTFEGAVARTIDVYNTTSKYIEHVPLRTTMRTPPSVTLYSPDTGSPSAAYVYGSGGQVSASARDVGESGFNPYRPVAGGSNEFNVQLHYTADASL